MGFWGIEVKPGKPHPYHSDNVEGRLCVTQATLGLGSTTERSILQCSVGHKSPIFLCSLLPNKSECCSLNLEFKDELVAFSVIGSRSIYLSGYFVSDEGDNLRDEYVYDSGEGLSDSETNDEDGSSDDYDESIDFDDEDSEELFQSPSKYKSGVVIEEIEEDPPAAEINDSSKQGTGKDSKIKAKKSEKIKNAKSNSSTQDIDSEDEDGFPISVTRNAQVRNLGDGSKNNALDNVQSTEKLIKHQETNENLDVKAKKRRVKDSKQDATTEAIKKKKKPKLTTANLDNATTDDNADQNATITNVVQQAFPDPNKLTIRADTNAEANGMTSSVSEKKKKKKKKQESTGPSDLRLTATGSKKKGNSASIPEEKELVGKPSQARSFPNGLVVEEVKIGIPDGKKASDGSRVCVHYIGKLKKTGKIFDSSVGGRPFEFRLGVAKVIQGWDVGIKGMRVGDKRRLTIPPSMGYGDKGAGGKIPPNAWLEFDVELVDVR